MVKKNTKCTCDCHTAELVAVEEPAPPKAKGTGKAKKSAKSTKGKSPAQILHQTRFGLVAKLKKQHPDWSTQQLWDYARKEIQ